ncbi:MAG: hypothetical protein V7K14_21805, partial [Nostoc sp.]
LLTKLDLSFSTINCCFLYLISFLAYFVAPSGQLDDPAEQPEIFPRVRDEIRERVTQLIQSVNKQITPAR